MNPQDSLMYRTTCQDHDGAASRVSSFPQGASQPISGTRVCCDVTGRRKRAFKKPARGPERDPAGLKPLEATTPAASLSLAVCPRCQRQVTTYGFVTNDGLTIMTYHCDQHGDVVPSVSTLKRLKESSSLHS